MNEETKRMKLIYWSGVIKEAKSSGMKITDWCEKNQITNRQYYYWHKKVMHDTYTNFVEGGLFPDDALDISQQTLPSVPDFAELTVPNKASGPGFHGDAGIDIKCKDFTISVSPDFSEGDLARVLKVIHHV